MINTALNAFSDVAAVFDRALSAPKGVRIVCATRGSAIRLRQRFNYYRKLDREQNKKVYAPEDPQHGLSIYDRLELRIPPKGDPGETSLYIEPRRAEALTVEEIA